MTRFLALTAIFCVAFSAAIAGETYRWNHETHITIQPTSQPGAVAEVVFSNTDIHVFGREVFDLTLGDITVTVVYEMNVNGADDRFTVTPPPGYLAIPETLVVPEEGAGVIFVFQDGMM